MTISSEILVYLWKKSFYSRNPTKEREWVETDKVYENLNNFITDLKEDSFMNAIYRLDKKNYIEKEEDEIALNRLGFKYLLHNFLWRKARIIEKNRPDKGKFEIDRIEIRLSRMKRNNPFYRDYLYGLNHK